MKHSSWLTRLAVLVWLAWLGLVGMMLGFLRLRVWHPHFLPIAAVFILLPLAAIALFIAGAWRVIRGPRRVHALCWLLLGLPPVGFLAGHMLYGYKLAFGRQVELNLPLKALIPVGDSMLDLLAGFSYPERTTGQRVVMISARLREPAARQQVAMMDRHINLLESQLGRSGGRRAYWVRGPVMGLEGKAVDALCLASRADESGADPGSLTTLDKHEVAHVVLNQFCTMGSERPAVLAEGWAEVSSGIRREALIVRALRAKRDAGRNYSLKELLGPVRYGRHESAAYVQGAILVDYILREFGPDRFLVLYTTCRQATFEEDCRRILGVTVDELDRAYWAEVEKRAGPGGYARLWLSSLELGPGVHQADWENFISLYFTATERMLAPYSHVRLTSDLAYTSTKPGAEASTVTWRYELKGSGRFRALRAVFPGREEVYLAHPEHSFRAARENAADAWVVKEGRTLTREQSYQRTVDEIERTEPVKLASAPLVALADSFTNLLNPLCAKVAKLERFSQNGRRLIRVEFEELPPGHPVYRTISVDLAADSYALAHMEYVTKTGKSWREDAVVGADSLEAVPVLSSTRSEGREEDGGTTNSTLTVSERRFGPVAEDEFTSERVLGGRAVRYSAGEPGPFSEEPRYLNWYPLPIVLGMVSLVAGASVFPWARRSEPIGIGS